MSENTNGRMSPMEKMIRSANYGKREMTDEQVAEAMADTGPMFDVNSTHPSDSLNAVSAYPARPDYADIQRLENMVWQATSLHSDYHAYSHEYHQLAVKYTEDMLILAIEQYNRGVKW